MLLVNSVVSAHMRTVQPPDVDRPAHRVETLASAPDRRPSAIPQRAPPPILIVVIDVQIDVNEVQLDFKLVPIVPVELYKRRGTSRV
jgi:hypothetical protein